MMGCAASSRRRISRRVARDAAFSVPVQTVSEVIDLGDFYTIIYVDARDDGDVAPLSDPKVEEEVRRRVRKTSGRKAWSAG